MRSVWRPIAFILALLESGCSLIGGGIRYKPNGQPDCPSVGLPIVDTAIVIGAGIAIGYARQGAQHDCHGFTSECSDGYALGEAASLSVGLPYAVSAIYGYLRVSGCHEDATRPVVERAAEPPPSPAAMTERAAAAARAGDCATVKKFDPAVDALDATYHDTVFVRDAAIARCLRQSAPIPTAPEPIDAGVTADAPTD